VIGLKIVKLKKETIKIVVRFITRRPTEARHKARQPPNDTETI